MNTYAKRLVHAIELRKTNQTELAAAIGVKPQAIQYLCKKGTKSAYTNEICNVLKINPNWLSKNIGGISDSPQISENIRHVKESQGSYNDKSPTIQPIPIISSVTAGNWGEIVDTFAPGDTDEYTYTAEKVSDKAFALRIQGDSMQPTIPDGAIIIVDPNVQAQHKSIVVVRQNSDTEATCKRLIIEGSQYLLKPDNERYPIMQMTDDAIICGVAISLETKLI